MYVCCVSKFQYVLADRIRKHITVYRRSETEETVPIERMSKRRTEPCTVPIKFYGL